MQNEMEEQSYLILAAEDCPREEFSDYHRFTASDRRIIAKLIAHGPVLLRGGRGSGKSALMIEASIQLAAKDSKAFGVYLSLRHLELLKSEGKEYEELFCRLLTKAVQERVRAEGYQFEAEPSVSSIQSALSKLTIILNSRLVLFFDDAAHLGREASLEVFFDIFRTLSSSTVSCKAAIYPGVTKFGIRFDVYNDATVVDISRNDELPGFDKFFADVAEARSFRASLFGSNQDFIKNMGFLGRSVVGNMRAFVFMLYELASRSDSSKIGLNNLSDILLSLAGNYYWPLLEELRPKLGRYEKMIDPAKEIARIVFETCGKNGNQSALVHRDIINKLAKPFEMLEYAGFMTRRDVSRAMKSGGRGSRFILSLCVLLEHTPGTRLTREIFERWNSKYEDSIEFHRGSEVYGVELPELPEFSDPAILKEPVDKLAKSAAYPYGLTERQIRVLIEAGIEKVGDLASASDEQLLGLAYVGQRMLKRFRNVVEQAIWI